MTRSPASLTRSSDSSHKIKFIYIYINISHLTRSPASLTFPVREEKKIREKKFLRGKCNYTILTRYLFENASHITSESCRLLIQWGKEQKLYKSDLTSRNFGWGDKSITTKWNFISKVDSEIHKSLKELINRYGCYLFSFFGISSVKRIVL